MTLWEVHDGEQIKSKYNWIPFLQIPFHIHPSYDLRGTSKCSCCLLKNSIYCHVSSHMAGNYSNNQMGTQVTKSSHLGSHRGWKGSPPSAKELCWGTGSKDHTNLSRVWTHQAWSGFQSCGNTVLKYRLKSGPWCLRINGNYFYLVIQKVHDQKPTNNFLLLYVACISEKGVEFKPN